MLYQEDNLNSLVGFLGSVELNGYSLDRPVAFSIKGGAQEGQDVWVIVRFSNGNVTSAEYLVSGIMADADNELQVAIVIQATDAHWREIGSGGEGAAIMAADRKVIAISGKLPYFIRHVRSTVNLIEAFGNAVTISNPM